MAFNIGINVLETDGSAAPAIAGAPTSVAGFIIRSRRGPTNETVRVSNFRQFKARFGDYHPVWFGSYAIDGFFQNGGREAYIARVVNNTDDGKGKAATIMLSDRLGSPTLNATAGYRGAEEIGAWGNDLVVSIQDHPEFPTEVAASLEGNKPARLQGTPLQSTIDLSPVGKTLLREFRLKVNDQPLDIIFSELPVPTKATPADIVSAINKKGNGIVKAVLQPDGISLTSYKKGRSSRIEIVNTRYEETRIRLGFGDGNKIDNGEDEAGNNSAKPAELEGNPLTGDVDLTSLSDTLLILVDDKPTPFSVSLRNIPEPTKGNAEKIAAAIRNQIGEHVEVSSSDQKITITSKIAGAKSRIEIITDNTSTILGFTVGTQNSGEDADNSAQYSEVQVKSNSGFQVGDWVRLSDGITENWHQITEISERKNDGKTLYFVGWDERKVSARNEYRVEDKATLSTAEFDLIVSLKTSSGKPQIVETWSKLTLDKSKSNYALLRINDKFSGSTYIVLNPAAQDFDFRGSNSLGVVEEAKATETGSDGGAPAFGDYKEALQRFKANDIQLLAIPEVLDDDSLKSITEEAISYCEGRGDCMFIGHTPQGRDAEGAKTFSQDFRRAKVYGAMYWPWITVSDPIGWGSNPTRVIPAIGHVLGVYARIDQTRGIWKAPAGNEAVVRGALAVEHNITDIDHTDLVKNGSVNGIRQIRGTGIVLDASRTLSTDTRWLYINVRLLFNYVKVSLREGLRWVKQEPNRDSLWNKIKYNVVTPFLLRLYQDGAFGTGTPEQVFTVICSAENNPPEDVDLGNLSVEVYFYPGKPAETIIITVGQQESGATTGER